MNGLNSQQNLSPLAKDLHSIGKLINKHTQNPQNYESPISTPKHIINTVAINTSPFDEQKLRRSSQKLSTRFKMNSSVFNINLHQNSQYMAKIQNRKPQAFNSQTERNHPHEKSPVGIIYKQYSTQKNVPLTPKSSINPFKSTAYSQFPQIHKADLSSQRISKFRGSLNGDIRQFQQSPLTKNQEMIGKTYTSSMLKKNQGPQENEGLKNPKRAKKKTNSKVKLPSFLNNSQATKRQYQQQTTNFDNPSKLYFDEKDEEERDFDDEEKFTSSKVYGFILNKEHPEITVSIDLRTSVSRIKQLLVEGEMNMFVNFKIPQIFFMPPSLESTSQELHFTMQEAFSHLDLTPQIVSIKKFSNCVMMREKKLCILWNFNGKVYFGGWKGEMIGCEGVKEGVGVEWFPGRYIYYGQYKDNKKQGYGIMKKSNKEIYVGCWKNNQRNGWGKVYGSEGKLTQDGQFLNGCLLLRNRQTS